MLSTASLTGFVERGIYNGIIPITLTDYSQDSGGSDRNNPISGNCAVRKNTGGASNSIFVDTGVACLDGAFYSTGTVSAIDIDTAARYNARFNPGGMVLPTALNEECWVLVIVDPELAGAYNNVGFVGGTVVDTSTGIYPQMPANHLIKQSAILGAVRVTYGTPTLVVAACEDKRVFIRGGPIPITSLFDSAGNPTDPINDYGVSPSLNAGDLPITNLGEIYGRNPQGFQAIDFIHGAGETHLFYQADNAIGSGAGGAYQLTPVHRQAKETLAYIGAGAVGLTLSPLLTEFSATEHLITATWFDATGVAMAPLKEGPHYSVSGKTLTFTDLGMIFPPLGPLGPGDVVVSYTHAGY